MRLGIHLVRIFTATWGLLTAIQTIGMAQSLIVSPSLIRFTATVDSFSSPGPEQLALRVVGADKLEFKFVGVVPSQTGGPNFVIVSPSSGVAPAVVWLALNPNVVPYMGSGGYALELQFATPGQSCPMPAPATLQPSISPGELVSIFGTHLSTPPITTQYDSAGLYPSSLGISRTGTPGTQVTFNGTPAALLYVSQTQINAQVPYEVAGQKNVTVVVTHNFAPSPSHPRRLRRSARAALTGR